MIRVKVNDSCGKRRFNVKMTVLEREGKEYIRVSHEYNTRDPFTSPPLFIATEIFT